MKLIEQKCIWMQKPKFPLEIIEKAGRTCYKSEDKITSNSAKKFVNMIVKRGHESVIEHAFASVKFITNRGVTHELVRHRLCSFSQESTRYVNYSSNDIQFIKPVWTDITLGVYNYDSYIPTNWNKVNTIFILSCLDSESSYKKLLNKGWRPEQAREVLPNSLKTEIIVTTNLREWKHIFKLRTSKSAHPQIRELMKECLNMFKKEVPILFDDI